MTTFHRSASAIVPWLSLLIGSLVACSAAPTPGSGAPLGNEYESSGTEQPIVGGTDATAVYPEGAIVGSCSGVVIAPKVVLTAAHCVYGKKVVSVKVPAVDKAKWFNGAVATPPNSKGGLGAEDNDVALVFFSESLPLSYYPVVAMKRVSEGTKVIQVGRRGPENSPSPTSGSTLYLSQPVALSDGAAKNQPNTYYAQAVMQNGDSGGPAFVASLTPHTIVAVNSQLSKDNYELLARTDLLFDWIEKGIKEHGGHGPHDPGGGGGGGAGGAPPSGCEGDLEQEPNDTYQQPQALQSEALCGKLDPSGDQDWFTWSVSGEGIPYEVSVQGGDVQLTMWKLVNGQYHKLTNTTPTSLKNTSNGAGTYYIAIKSPTATLQEYRLTVQGPFPPSGKGGSGGNAGGAGGSGGVGGSAPNGGSAGGVNSVDPQRIYGDINTLASDEFGGRKPGTAGGEKTVAFVESFFQSLGLKPSGSNGGYRQPIYYNQQLSTGAALQLGSAVLEEGTDFQLLTGSGSGSASGELVFVGYGLSIPPYSTAEYPDCPVSASTGYDDYAGVDVHGKVVLVLRHGPSDDSNVGDRCPGGPALASLGQAWHLGYKAANAKLHGATAMILVQDYAHESEHLDGTLSDYADASFPAASVDRDLLEKQVTNLQSWQSAIDQTWQPASQATGVVALLGAQVATQSAATVNLLATVPGVDPQLSSEVVVIGAHLDHLGTKNGGIYHGADDNASGTAVMMELARLLVGSGVQPARTVLFAAWNAEEDGLVGSCFYVKKAPAFPLNKTVAAFSLDMVGAGNGTGVLLAGATEQKSAWIKKLMTAFATTDGLSYKITAGPPENASDDACFGNYGVPAVMVTTLGQHSYYHTQADTINTINKKDLELTAKLLWSTLQPLVQGKEKQWKSLPLWGSDNQDSSTKKQSIKIPFPFLL